MFLIQIAISASQIRRKFIFKLRSLSRISCGLIVKNQQVEEFLLKMSLVFLFVCLKEMSTCKERPLEIQNGCFLHNKATCQRTRSNSTSKLQRSYLSSCNIQGANSTTLHHVMYCSVQRNCTCCPDLGWDPQLWTTDQKSSPFIFTISYNHGCCA